MKLVNSGQREQGLAMLAEASQLEPNNSRYRVDYLNQQSVAVRDLLARADAGSQCRQARRSAGTLPGDAARRTPPTSVRSVA